MVPESAPTAEAGTGDAAARPPSATETPASVDALFQPRQPDTPPVQLSEQGQDSVPFHAAGLLSAPDSLVPAPQDPSIAGALAPPRASVPAAAVPAAPPQPPAAQAASALVALASGRGGSSLVVRLAPAELGVVQIRMERQRDGAAHVVLNAERPETLALLVGDQTQLHRALDQAGVPADRTLSFHLAQIAPEPTAARPGPQMADAAPPNGTGAALPDTNPGGSGSGNGAPDRGPARVLRTGQASRDSIDSQPSADAPRWMRLGVNITA